MIIDEPIDSPILKLGFRFTVFTHSDLQFRLHQEQVPVQIMEDGIKGDGIESPIAVLGIGVTHGSIAGEVYGRLCFMPDATGWTGCLFVKLGPDFLHLTLQLFNLALHCFDILSRVYQERDACCQQPPCCGQ